MRNGNSFKTGVAAAIGAGLLVVTPTMSNARSPGRFEICPAIDTEPVCDLAAQTPSDGAGAQPATVEHSTARGVDVVDVNVPCTGRPIVRYVPCAE